MEALRSHRHWELLGAVLTEVGDHDEGPISSGVTAIGLDLSGGIDPDGEGVRRGCGGLLPLNGAVARLCPDAVGVNLRLQKLASSKVVTLDSSRFSSEILDTVSWGSKLDTLDTYSKGSQKPFVTYFHVAVQEICLARMLNVLAVVRPPLL